jgi:septum formation protein
LIWLASRSPRRRQLLERAGYPLHICPTDVDESIDPNLSPVTQAEALATRKAQGVDTPHVVLAADTIVHLEREVLGKPRDRDQAKDYLTRLSGRWHEVTTGVCLARGTDVHVFHTTTRVTFRSLSTFEITAYVETGDADDKAGAYGIQSGAAPFVADVQGSWTNVVGLPLEACIPLLDALGVTRESG